MKINIYETQEDLYKELADFYIDQIQKNPQIVLGFATGSTPIPLYKKLREAYKLNRLSFKDVTTFNLDEYVGLPKTHQGSYYSFMVEELFKHIDIDPNKVHMIDGALDPSVSIVSFQNDLDNYLIDIQLLGVGTNGHIGFNEPGTPFNSKTHKAKLTANTIEDNSRMFDNIDEVPHEAITMGISDIMGAQQIIMVITGSHKAKAAYQMIHGPVVEDMPCSILQQHPNVVVYLDKAAASLL